MSTGEEKDDARQFQERMTWQPDDLVILQRPTADLTPSEQVAADVIRRLEDH